jgi:hypothetical protein
LVTINFKEVFYFNGHGCKIAILKFEVFKRFTTTVNCILYF